MAHTDTHMAKLQEAGGATILLQLSSTSPALFSVTGDTWLPLTGIEQPTDGREYTFTSGLIETSDAVVTVDTSIVACYDDAGKIPASRLHGVADSYECGLTLTADNTLTIVDSNTPGNIVVVPASGVLPPEIVPQRIYTAGGGIEISEDNVISEKWVDYRNVVP